MSSFPETENQQPMLDDGTTGPDPNAWLIVLAFVGLAVLLAILLAIYVLAWDGGAHT